MEDPTQTAIPGRRPAPNINHEEPRLTPLSPDFDSDMENAYQRDNLANPVFEFIVPPHEQAFAREMALTGDLYKSFVASFSPDDHRNLSPAKVRAKAAHLLSKPRIDERYQYYKTLLASRMDIRSDRILRELASIAFADPADYYEADGRTLRNIHTIPSHARATLESFETGVTRDGNYTKMKLAPKMAALKMLVDIKNMTADSNRDKAPTINIALAPTPSSTSSSTSSQSQSTIPTIRSSYDF